MRARFVGLLIVMNGCLPPALVECEDGLLCPSERVCDRKRNQCVSVEQVTACAGLGDGAPCTTSIGTGVCDASVCVEAFCGDGYVTADEACDDGNATGADGCNADCSSSERCGNGVVDIDQGETCDCGADELAAGCISLNSDTPGTECKANCVLQCGDGVVNAVEDCDTTPTPGGCVAFGFDRGPLTCSSSCANDISDCGEFGLQRIGGPGLPGVASGHWVAPTGETFLAGGPFLAAQSGTAWTIEQDGLLDSWTAVSGVDASFVLAVGTHSSFEGNTSTMMKRWDGSQWDWFTPPTTPGATWFTPRDVHVESPSDIVAIGTYVILGPQLIEELGLYAWDGAQWTRLLPDLPGSLLAVTQMGGGDIVAVGNDGLVVFRRSGVWSMITLDGAPDLRAVWAGDGIVVAVGVDGAIVRYSIANDTWTADPSPSSATSFRAVAGRSASDLYASSGTPTSATTVVPELWHWDGRTWFPVEVDASVGGISTLEVGPLGAIVGQGANFTTYRLAPGGWGSRAVSDLTIFGELAPTITGSGDTVFAGTGFFTYRYRASRGLEQITVGQLDPMHALSADELVVGRDQSLERVDLTGPTAAFTAITQRCVEACPPEDAPCTPPPPCLAPAPIVAIGVPQPEHFVFVGRRDDGMTILYERTPDEIRTEVTRSSTDPFVAVTSANANAYALTRQGHVWSNELGEWRSIIDLPLTGTVLWGTPNGTIFAGGEDGVIWRRFGGQWEPLPTETHERINSIHGSTATDPVTGMLTDVFATTQTTVHHFDGKRWSPVRAHPDGVGAVWTTEHDAYFVKLGKFRRLERPTPW